MTGEMGKLRGDCHIHMVLDSVDFRAAREQHREQPSDAVIRRVLETYRQAGVTFLRDGGDDRGVALRASRLAPEYGIRYCMPVFAIHRSGRYGRIVGLPYRDLEEFRSLMRRAKALGADFIKVMVSGILDFGEAGKLSCDSLPAEEIRTIVEMIHQEDLAAMLHINGRAAVLAAIEAGADSLEHGFGMDEECCAALGEHPDTVWVPSLAPVGNQIGTGSFPDRVLQEILAGQQENIRRAVKAGGRIALGSDAGARHVPHGAGTADERGYILEALAGERLPGGPVMTVARVDEMLAENEHRIRERFCRR